MRPRKVVSRDECVKFNILRQKYSNRTFGYNELFNLIKKEIGWKESKLISELISSLFNKLGRGKYAFPENPIYIGKIQYCVDIVAKRRKGNFKINKQTPVQKAIELLKSEGFSVIKKSFDLEAALQNPDKLVGQFIIVEEF